MPIDFHDFYDVEIVYIFYLHSQTGFGHTISIRIT